MLDKRNVGKAKWLLTYEQLDNSNMLKIDELSQFILQSTQNWLVHVAVLFFRLFTFNLPYLLAIRLLMQIFSLQFSVQHFLLYLSLISLYFLFRVLMLQELMCFIFVLCSLNLIVFVNPLTFTLTRWFAPTCQSTPAHWLL